jgi:hypothetical protein
VAKGFTGRVMNIKIYSREKNTSLCVISLRIRMCFLFVVIHIRNDWCKVFSASVRKDKEICGVSKVLALSKSLGAERFMSDSLVVLASSLYEKPVMETRLIALINPGGRHKRSHQSFRIHFIFVRLKYILRRQVIFRG